MKPKTAPYWGDYAESHGLPVEREAALLRLAIDVALLGHPDNFAGAEAAIPKDAEELTRSFKAYGPPVAELATWVAVSIWHRRQYSTPATIAEKRAYSQIIRYGCLLAKAARLPIDPMWMPATGHLKPGQIRADKQQALASRAAWEAAGQPHYADGARKVFLSLNKMVVARFNRIPISE